MNNYINEMLKRKQELESAILRAENFMQKAPRGRLRISNSHGSSQFYYVSDKTGHLGKYIPKTHNDLITRLVQKEYSKIFLKEATK